MGDWWQRVRGVLGIGGRPDDRVGRHPDGVAGAEPDGRLEAESGVRSGRRQAGQGDLVQALIDGLLHHDNPDVRAGTARKLGELGPSTGPRAVEALERALRDEDAGVRSSAALSLGEHGAHASRCIPALIEALADPDDDVRSSAGIALEDIGSAGESAPVGALEQALTKALNHSSPLVRGEAEVLLQRLSKGQS